MRVKARQPEDDRAWLAAIVQASQDAIVGKSLDGIVTSWNRGAERIFGYRAEEAIGRPVTFLIPEDLHDEEPAILRRVRAGERVEPYETVRRRKDGTLIQVALSVSPVLDGDGRIVGASKIARDITDRVRIEASLRETEDRSRRLSELLPVGVYTCEAPGGTITYFNQRAAEIWGRSPKIGETDERFCGSLKLYLPDGDAPLPHAECPMAVALREGRAFRNEEVVVERPDGSRRMILVNIDPLFDGDGAVIGAINALHDITELKEAQRSARDQGAAMDTLLETVPAAVFLAHDREARRITGNRAANDLLRMGAGANLSKSAPPGEAPSHFQVMRDGRPIPNEDLPVQRAARGEVIQSEEIDIVFEDGSGVHSLVSAQPLFDDDGNPRGAVAAFMDVTELKAVEAALREAHRRKDDFLATLSHELRNPLAPILTGLEVMGMVGDIEAAEDTRRRVERQAKQLVRLVDDLLDVSRITTGKMELRRTRVDLEQVVEDAVAIARPAIEQKGQVLAVDVPDRPVSLDGDADRLVQVFANLLNNAAAYTLPGGHVDLTVRREGNEVVITVRDDGVGIEEGERERIFQMFYQAGRSHEKGHGGLGLGLTLARALVELHGGAIEAESPGLGGGSTFWVRLPLNEQDAPGSSQAPGTATTEASQSRRVLIVDDNDAYVESLSLLVEMLGHEVRTAPDGRTALDVAAEFLPDVVLMDIGMPGMSGYETARRMRDESWGADVLVVALTGWSQEEHRRKTAEAGFDHHLVKPAKIEELRLLLVGESPETREFIDP